MQDKIFDYMVAKQSSGVESAGLDGLKDHLRHQKEHSSTEQSTICTLGVLPDHAESLDSSKTILDSVHDLYGVGALQTHHMVVGDQKLFSNMQRLKRQYGAELEWLLPYPGDWHILKNFQPVLSKPSYHHAGLRDLAAEAGYKLKVPIFLVWSRAPTSNTPTSSTWRCSKVFISTPFGCTFVANMLRFSPTMAASCSSCEILFQAIKHQHYG